MCNPHDNLISNLWEFHMKQENKQTKEQVSLVDEYRQYATVENIKKQQLDKDIKVLETAISQGKSETKARATLRNTIKKQKVTAIELVRVCYPFVMFLGYTFQSNNTNNKKVNETNKEVQQKLLNYGLTYNQVKDLLVRCKGLKAVNKEIKNDDINSHYDQAMQTLQKNEDVLNKEIKPESNGVSFDKAVDLFLGDAEKEKKKRANNRKTILDLLDKTNNLNVIDYTVKIVTQDHLPAVTKLLKNKGYVIVDEKEYKSLTQPDPVEVTMNNVQHAINQ